MVMLHSRFPEADLHCHTTASDGLLTPRELVQAAAQIGLKAVGITDHDTISGWNEAEQAGLEFGIVILKGIELNTDYHGTEVHILGYEPDPDSQELRRKLEDLRQARRKRMQEIVRRLWTLGLELAVEEIQKIAKGESIGRPHIAQALMQKGYVQSIREAFDRYIGAGAPAYVPRFKLTPEEGIRLVRQAGGVAVLAHPGVHQLGRFMGQWIQVGLQGVEVSHSEHTADDEQRCRALAEEYGLIMTGGSDFHGEKRKPGVKLGGWGVSLDVVYKIKEMAQRNGHNSF